MTFDASVPNAGQSPGLFPAQGSTNFTRLKALINAEHVFNDSFAVTDGVHRQMTLINRADPVALPAGTNGMIYLANNRPKAYDGNNTYFLPPLLASVVFNNNAGISGTTTNVASVTKNGTGDFTITFTNALPSTNGPWTTNAFSNSDTTLLVCGLGRYTINSVRVLIRNASTGVVTDPALASFMIYNGY